MGNKMKTSILAVVDEPELWEGKEGYKGASAVCILDGGVKASYSSKPEYVQGHIDALKKLVGQEIEIEVEDKGQFGYKLIDYPGKPGGGGGFKKGGGGNYNAQYALLAAAYSGATPEVVIETAEKIYLPWLKRQAGGAESSDRGAARTPPSSGPVVDKGPDGKSQPNTVSLAQIRALRGVIDSLGWDEAYACQQAGVERLGDILAADVGPLIAKWSKPVTE